MSTILALVLHYSALYGVDPLVALSVIRQESNFQPHAVGTHGEIGLMQLMPQYFPMPKKKLFEVETNIKLGIRHLAQVKAECVHHKEHTYLVCFNVGVAGGNRIRHPKKFPYYQKVMKNYHAFH